LSSASGLELLKLARASAVVLGLTYAGASLAGRFAIFDNLSNFPVHFAAGFLAFAILFTALKSRSWALASCGAAALAFAPVVPWYFGPAAAPGDATRQFAKFLVSNVYVANDEHELLRQRIAEENPDLVGLVEVNSTWISKLESLRAGYPYHFEVPDERFVGLALYSRLPLSNPRVLDLGPPSTPAIAATVKTQTGELELILAHPVPPMNAEFIRQRNAQILSISRYVGTSGKPIVLAGDLNITMWNDGYRPLSETGGLQNARDGHGVGPTWPSVLPIGVPIDHILATRDVALREFRVLRSIGSDHLPISAEFSLR
jgi:endonuclease/exonuclease/phosphatase (EEP) superfamily protein YafD